MNDFASGSEQSNEAAEAVARLTLLEGGLAAWPRETLRGDHERHQAAVARSIGWARESAARGDYADALGWIKVIEAIGDSVSLELEVKRQAWRAALAGHQARQRRLTAEIPDGPPEPICS